MERTADPLYDARAQEANAFDSSVSERGGVAAAVEPMRRRDHARERQSQQRAHDRRDRPTTAPDTNTAAAPRRARSNGRVVRPPSTVAEAYHQHLAGLVQHLFLETDAPARAVMFMAVDRGRDTALLPAAAAEILAAQVSGRICLVDANVLAPSLHQHYDVLNEQGLVTALSDDAPVRGSARLLAQGPESSLWLVPSGTTTVDAVGAGAVGAAGSVQSLFTAPSSVSRIRELIAAFDYVVIEGPPVGSSEAASSDRKRRRRRRARRGSERHEP